MNREQSKDFYQALTEWRRHNRHLRVLQLAGDISPASHWIKEYEGKDLPLRMLWISNRYTEMWGIRPEAYEGRTDFDVWPKETARTFWKNDLECLRGGRSVWVIEPTDRGQALVCKYPVSNREQNFIGVAGIGIPIDDVKGIICDA